jgi:hypothetical protein
MPLIAALVAFVVIVAGLLRQPGRTSVWLLPFLPILLVVGTILAFISGELAPTLLVVAGWLACFGGLLLVTRRDEPSVAEDPGSYEPVIRPWIEVGFSEIDVFRLNARARSVIIAMRRPVEATVLVMAMSDPDRPGTWAFSTALGEGSGILLTTTDPVGMLDFGEVRQIISGEEDAWEVHRDALAYCASLGITVNRDVGESLQDHVLWMRSRDRRAARRFPLSLLAMTFRPMFHLGPLRHRRGASRQLRSLNPHPVQQVSGENL